MEDILKKYDNNQPLTPQEERQLLEYVENKKNELKALRKSPPAPQRGEVVNGWWWGLAASFLLLLGVGAWLWSTGGTPQYKRLVAAHLRAAAAFSTNKMGAPSTDSVAMLRTRAKIAADQQRYEVAANYLSQMMQLGDSTAENHYALALCGLKMSPPAAQRAIGHLQQCRALAPTWQAAEVNFYLGLAYIENKEFEKAKAALNKNVGQFWTAQTVALLKALP
ncbi:MAG: hypothetical protein RL757_3185 [Bacteroidota bacterium]|jgi:tetratricopeptide (TPR) repeat protein